MAHAFLVTCEHGGNRVPARYRSLFAGYETLLRSHRGYDAGALALARQLSAALEAPLFLSTVSRLLIDLNRSIGHPRLYSEATRPASVTVRREILERHYLRYRQRVEEWIARQAEGGSQVLHIAAHSFTPVLDGEVRQADVGLLYDPVRPSETALCRRWQLALREDTPALRVRRNYPYSGRSDGFTAHLRRRFPDPAYVGIELEVNQRQVGRTGWPALRRQIVAALLRAVA